ncbi:hypothetical protein [Mycolicibacterium fortuitum]|uniref:hypothetical protein n=1 Tax=Mycolicibacterium fortuitum TaxID=1766 RepID=UPI001CDD0ADE|nr:hypothetical protein [Mycolicibacterium fortuitum]UBV13015.1 hypothetical protein H8Z57_19265 [Mycolicibacterium fortuitum]
MTRVRTLRFHTEYGLAPLFDKARGQLKGLAGLNLEIPHARSRFDERGGPLQYLTDFQPESWEVVVVETAVHTGGITYMSLRRKVESNEYLWIVLAHEHVITAWVTRRPSNRAAHPLNVKDGPAWDAAAEGKEPAVTGAMAEWADAYARRVRARQVLAALATVPERPSGDRLALAARLVLKGHTWNEAAVEAGWGSRAPVDAAITRLLRAVKRSGAASAGD